MRALLDELAAILTAARASGIPIAVIGACALRTYLSSPDRRTSVDADVLTTKAGLVALESLLTARRYHVYDLGPWRRAERNADRMVIDIAVDHIVDVRTFRPYAIDWTTIVNRSDLPVPRVEDLLAQKLVSAREKDLLDVILVASDSSVNVSPEVFARVVESNDVEVAVARGILEAEAAVRSGQMARLWAERLAEAPPSFDGALRRLQAWRQAR